MGFGAFSQDWESVNAIELQSGQAIIAPFLPAPAAVKKFHPRSGYSLLEVVLDDGHHTYKPLRITKDQLAQIEAVYSYVLESPRIRFLIADDSGTGTDAPQLHRIQNPSPHFQLDEDIFATKFIVPETRGGGRKPVADRNRALWTACRRSGFYSLLMGSPTTACLCIISMDTIALVRNDLEMGGLITEAKHGKCCDFGGSLGSSAAAFASG